MKLTYTVPDLTYSAKNIAEFLALSRSLQGDTFAGMGNAVFALYPDIREDEIRLLPQSDLEKYCIDRLRFEYEANRPKFMQNAAAYQGIWEKYSSTIAHAFGEIFQVDTASHYNDMIARVTLCPICPRFLQDRSFDIFHQYSAEGSLYVALHEITHFLWFDTWGKLFDDPPEHYEQPHFPWIFSELAIDAILPHPRLNSIIFDNHQAKFPAYPEFYEIQIGERPLVSMFRDLYGRHTISGFMQEGYHFLNENKALFAPFFG